MISSISDVVVTLIEELENFDGSRRLVLTWGSVTGPKYLSVRFSQEDMRTLKSMLEEAILPEGGAKHMKKKKAVSKLKLATTAKAKKLLKAKKK